MNWRKSGIGIAIGMVIIALLAYGLTVDPREVPSPLPGNAAPTFALPTMEEGDIVDLAGLRGQVVVLNFWASWCVPCRYEHGDLVTAAGRYQPLGVRFYGIVYQDSPRNAKAFIDELGGINYPSLLDEGTRTGIAYGITGVPETFVIDQAGTIVFKHNGPITAGQLASVIEPLLGDGAHLPSAGHSGGAP